MVFILGDSYMLNITTYIDKLDNFQLLACVILPLLDLMYGSSYHSKVNSPHTKLNPQQSILRIITGQMIKLCDIIMDMLKLKYLCRLLIKLHKLCSKFHSYNPDYP